MTQHVAQPCMPKLASYALALGCGPVGAWLMMQSGMGLRGGACATTGLLTLLLIAPIIEETVFRFGLQRWFAAKLPARFGCLSLANVLVALTFGTLHALHQGSALMLLTIVPALMFGWVWEISASRLIAPMLLHAWYNLCLVLASC